MNTPDQNQPSESDELDEILIDLWSKVDQEDVEEGLIDIGAIQDASDAIQALYAKQQSEAWKDGYSKGWKARKESTDGTQQNGESSASESD